jgi:hypothetical protein
LIRTPQRPSFAERFPRSPRLDAIVDAFARSDYARVRAEASALERTTDDPEIKTAARTLIERTRPDPLAIGLLALGAVLLVVFALWAVSNGHPPRAAH